MQSWFFCLKGDAGNNEQKRGEKVGVGEAGHLGFSCSEKQGEGRGGGLWVGNVATVCNCILQSQVPPV